MGQDELKKVEVVKLVKGEDCYEEVEKVRNEGEGVVELVEVGYGVMRMCRGDVGFRGGKK